MIREGLDCQFKLLPAEHSSYAGRTRNSQNVIILTGFIYLFFTLCVICYSEPGVPGKSDLNV